MQRKEPEFKSREQVLAFSPASSWLRDLGKEHNVSQPQFSHLPNGDNNTCVTGLFWEWDELMDIKLACVRLGFENLKAFILKMLMIKIYFIFLLLLFFYLVQIFLAVCEYMSTGSVQQALAFSLSSCLGSLWIQVLRIWKKYDTRMKLELS